MKALDIAYRADVIDEIAADFALREHNSKALHELTQVLAGDYDPAVELIMDMATGSGKTFLMAALIEYLRREGVGTVVIITPGSIVHTKTVGNFTPGHHRYIKGAPGISSPRVFHPGNYNGWGYAKTDGQNEFGDPINLFILNVHQLLAPTELDGATKAGTKEAAQRVIRRYSEVWGNVYNDLKNTDDLVVIVDETHIVSETAEAFTAAVNDLDPAAIIGLTASAAPKANETRTVFRYPLWQAIRDGHVKTPIIALRKGGYARSDGTINEEQQLRDALVLRSLKEKRYGEHALTTPGAAQIHPVLLVNCQSTKHAAEISSLLASPGYLGSEDAVLQVDNTTKNDEAVQARLDRLDQPDSPVRAVVSVDMLKEGWDSRSVAVLCSLRASTSEVLTQQTMGRGLRLPFGRLTHDQLIDQLDIIAHRSFESALSDEGVLRTFGLEEAVEDPDQKPSVASPVGPGASASDDGTTGEEDPAGASSAGSTGTAGAADPPAGHSAAASGRDVGDSEAGTSGWDSSSGPSAGANAGGEIGGAGARVGVGAATGATRGPGVAELDLGGAGDTDTTPQEPQVFAVNPGLREAEFYFPASRKMVGQPSPFNPAMLPTDLLQEKAAGVADSGETIERHRLNANPALRKLSVHRVLDATTISEPISREDAKAVILTELRKSSRVRRSNDPSWLRLVEGRVEVFMNAVTLDWTVNSASSAATIFLETFVETAREHARQHQNYEVTIHPVKVPVYEEVVIPAGVTVHNRGEEDAFYPQEPYQVYDQSLFPVVSFDARATEYEIAELLEASPEVSWWKRLDTARDGDAKIAVTPMNFYRPDFVVYEKATETYYVVEGKRSDEVDSPEVQSRATAVREVFAYLPAHPEFDGQTWRYMLVSEKDIKQAGNWAGLKVKAKS